MDRTASKLKRSISWLVLALGVKFGIVVNSKAIRLAKVTVIALMLVLLSKMRVKSSPGII